MSQIFDCAGRESYSRASPNFCELKVQGQVSYNPQYQGFNDKEG